MESPSLRFSRPVAVSEIIALCSVQDAVQARARKRYLKDCPVRVRPFCRRGPQGQPLLASDGLRDGETELPYTRTLRRTFAWPPFE
jgi:hypothetical protein